MPRQNSSDRTAYSVRWDPLRASKIMKFLLSSDKCGKSHRRSGSRRREECRNDAESAEAENTTAIQIHAGSQSFTNERTLDTLTEDKFCSTVANLIMIGFARSGYLWHRRAPPTHHQVRRLSRIC